MVYSVFWREQGSERSVCVCVCVCVRACVHACVLGVRWGGGGVL